MFKHKHFLTVPTLVLAAVSFGCVAGTNTYKVSATLLHDGKPYASPTVIVEPGIPADIAKSGQNGYTLKLTVTELGADKVRVASKITSARYGRTSPVVTVRLGQPVTVKVGRNETTTGVKLTVTRAARPKSSVRLTENGG